MQHIVTKFVIKVLAFAYFMFVWKYILFFFSKLRKICREKINKIKLAGRLTKEANATPKPNRENPIAHQKFADEACESSQPQIIPPKKATTIPPYIAST